MAVRKPHDVLGTTLFQNLIEYDSILSLFSLPTTPSPYTPTSFNQSQAYLNFHRPSAAICKNSIYSHLKSYFYY